MIVLNASQEFFEEKKTLAHQTAKQSTSEVAVEKSNQPKIKDQSLSCKSHLVINYLYLQSTHNLPNNQHEK